MDKTKTIPGYPRNPLNRRIIEQALSKLENIGIPEVTLTVPEAMVLRSFLDERFSDFVLHADHYGIEPNECEALYGKLDQLLTEKITES